jgi:hypothetical protein
MHMPLLLLLPQPRQERHIHVRLSRSDSAMIWTTAWVTLLTTGPRAPIVLPDELRKDAPEPFKETLRECLNSILVKIPRGRGDPAQAVAWGARPLPLQERGPMPSARVSAVWIPLRRLQGYRILTDRRYRICEKHGLPDPSQEGFRKLRSTQRQVQSLHWAIEDRAQRRASLYASYLDFEIRRFQQPRS